MLRHRIVATFVMMSIACASLARGAPATQFVKPIVPVFTLHGRITEAPADQDFPLFGVQPESMKDLLSRLKKAGDDANVKAIVIVLDQPWLGFAQCGEIREAMGEISAKGKPVYAYAEQLLFPQYVMISGAQRISMPPTGTVLATGLYSEQPYLRGLLDKIGVKPDFLTCGAYKSAAEIFMRDGPSPQADQMHNWLLDSIYQSSIDDIASDRKVSADKAKQWVNTGLYTAETAKKAGLIDAVETRQALGKFLKKQYGQDVIFDHKYAKTRAQQVDFSSPFAMFQVLGEMFGGGHKAASQKPAVGIVYVNGVIMLGKSEPTIFGSGGARSGEIHDALEQAAKDDSIKAVVLRIDSPGGSATASEIIFDACQQVKARKPLIVSMGNVAASGGYYVACSADRIFADDTSITASIGVVAGKLVTTDMWKKLGITFKPYTRGSNAGMLASDAMFSDSQRQQMQQFMNDVYATFRQHVADARGKKLAKPLDDIAGGRVYTGKQALDLGLVDQIGSLDDAVTYAAKQAHVENYDVRVVPAPKNFFQKIMEETNGPDQTDQVLAAPGTFSLVKLATPYLQGLDPQRVRAIVSSLEKLQLLEQDRVLMVMPDSPIN